MRAIRKIATSIILLGFPLSFASGCAPAGPGTSVTPAAPMPLSPRSGVAASANWRAAKKMAQWLQFGYDAGQTAYNPLEKTIDIKNVSNLQVSWNDETIVQPGGIVVDHNVAYVDDMGQTNAGLYALDANTGTQKWYANLNLNGSWGAFDHAVAAVAGNVVVSPCSNGSSSKFLTGLCGVSAKNGKLLWTTYCTQYQGNPCGGLVNGGTSPALYGKYIYFQSVQGVNEQPDTQALDPNNGKIAWDVAGVYHCPDGGDASHNPLPVANGLVFAMLACQGQSGNNEICALSATSGNSIWCDPAPTAVENLIASGKTLYVTEPVSSNVSVLALDQKTGAQIWAATLPGAGYSVMATTNKSLFVEDGGAGVYALSTSSGKSLWKYTANANLFGGGVLSVANGIVYADGGGGNNGNVAITAFNAKNGSIIWTSGSVANGAAPATPVIANGTVYAGCYTMCSFTLPNANNDRRE
ncbi:MAG: PQQ-binding-like beta-propeller repeat protein [Candidatus Cybelea sp.]